MRFTPIVALEVGTSKVAALVGEIHAGGPIVITGIGQTSSLGVRKGEVVDFQNAQACVRSVLSDAEEMSQVTIHQVHLAISGTHIESVFNRGSIPVKQQRDGITRKDVEAVMNVTRAINLTEDRELLHTICQNFYVDDHEPIMRPEGFAGSKLSLDMLIMHVIRNRLQNTVRVITSLDIEVVDTAFGGLCAALAVLTPEQKESGTLVIDLGGGTTDYFAYAGNAPIAAGTLGVGGDHFSNDLALAFKIPMKKAEVLKKQWGAATTDAALDGQRVELSSEDGFPGASIGLRALNAVIHVRAAELFGIIREQLETARALPHIRYGIILTGGGAYMKNIAPLAESVFDLPCVVGRSRGFTGQAQATDAPEFMAPLGMIRYGFMTAAQRRPRPWRTWFRDAFSSGRE